METSDDLYRHILTNGPSPGTIFLVLSRLKEKGQLRRVIQECLKALMVYPDDIRIRQLLADAYFEAGLISQAETELEKVTSQIGDFVIAYKRQAEIFTRQRREEEAVEALKLYLAHRPDDQDALDLFNTIKPAEEAPATETEPVIEEEVSSTLDGEGIPEIATPTLAEIYFDQGEILVAIKTYEKVVAQNPEDQRSTLRLEVLKNMIGADKPTENKETDKVRKKKEKMIAILEAWLTNIQAHAKSPLSA